MYITEREGRDAGPLRSDGPVYLSRLRTDVGCQLPAVTSHPAEPDASGRLPRVELSASLREAPAGRACRLHRNTFHPKHVTSSTAQFVQIRRLDRHPVTKNRMNHHPTAVASRARYQPAESEKEDSRSPFPGRGTDG